MKKITRLAMLAAVIVGTTALSGCIFASVAPPRGLIYTDQVAPLFPGGGAGEYTGRSSAHNIAFLAGWGDAGLRAAMQNAVDENEELDSIGDLVVRHSDYRAFNVLLLYQRYTTITYLNKKSEDNGGGPPGR
ncbi:MAG: hypothetical protein JJU11_17240 [Candidatus Sumerlaeia bacterium]|nr:hypothetical protein [Candidatus Sumerlaeia bacterium]